MRKTVTTLLVLLVVLIAADRIGVLVAQRAVAAQLRSSGELSVQPDVSIKGVPFLTQALRGRYSSIEVRARDVTAGGSRFSTFDASLAGVRLPLTSVLSGSVTSVPVEELSSTVVLSYDDLQQRLAKRRLVLAPAGDLLRVTGSVTVLGRTVSASALSRVRLSGTDVLVTAERFEVGAKPADRVLTAALGKRLDFRARIGALPYGLKLTGVAVRPDGVEAVAAARNTTLIR